MLGVDFGLLGPVEVRGTDGPITLGGPKERSILAALLLEANRVVSLGRLVDAAWGDDPPPTARTQARNRVSALRRALRGAGCGDAITTAGSGYVLRVDADRVDLGRFRRTLARAEEAVDPERAAELLSAALALWRGPALDGLSTPYLEVAARDLEERRLSVLERRIQLELDLGRHRELIPELTGLVSTHPYRERLHELLMLAQCLAGQRVAALETFRTIRTTLREQFGVEPGTPLRELHAAVLQDDVRPPTERPVAVRALPADVADFTGRAAELASLDAWLPDDTGTPPAVVISTVAGTAGVGKTALAVRWAHRAADRFPDGQLYLNLRGYSAQAPLEPVEALRTLLRALGARPDSVPLDETEAAAMYRSMLAGRRVLVLLDNARSVAQVRPLLPGSSGCLVLVTSRDWFGGLVARDGARAITVDVLTPDEAGSLLTRLLGAGRVAAEPDAADELAAACAYLPLALRIAAAHLNECPGRPLAGYVADLRADQLTALAVDGDEDAAVRATLDLSYQSVPAAARTLFRLLGLVPGPDLTAQAAAVLADLPARDAAALLNRLARAHLVEEREPGRFSCHDLLRRYAQEQAETEDAAHTRRSAVTRLCEWYLATAHAAVELCYRHLTRLVSPPEELGGLEFTDAPRAQAWLDDERWNLVAVIRHAAAHGPRPIAWHLFEALRSHFSHRGRLTDLVDVGRTALRAAEEEGDLRGQVTVYRTLAQVSNWFNRNEEAYRLLAGALPLARRAGWSLGEASVANNLGIVSYETGRVREAEQHLTSGLALFRANGNLAGEALALNNFSNFYRITGRLTEAVAVAEEAVEVFRRLGSDFGPAFATVSACEALHELGRHGEALDRMSEVLAVYRRHGNRPDEAMALCVIATLHTGLGAYEVACEFARASLRCVEESGHRRVRAVAQCALAAIHDRLGDRAEAVRCYEQALAEAVEFGAHRPKIMAMIGLASTTGAVEHAERALALARGNGYVVLERQASTVLSSLC